jgi:hypothetical protein
MSIKRYFAIKDNCITNAYLSDLSTRATGSNMGLADSVEVFSIFGQANNSSNEQMKMLASFPVLTSDDADTSIQTDRAAGTIPASGSVNFILRMYNVRTNQTVPRDFTYVVSPISQSWEEGVGVDLDNYSDLTYDGTGSNWINAAANTTWVDRYNDEAPGGSFLTASWFSDDPPSAEYNDFNYKQTFDGGLEDIEIDITGLVEQWILGTSGQSPSGIYGFDNYGIGIFLTGSQADSSTRSYYTKRFSSRSSEYFFKRPIIEARWNSAQKDNRGNFIVSSSHFSPADNKNTVYIYNYYRGQLKNLSHPNGDVSGNIYVNLRDVTSSYGSTAITATPDNPVTGGCVSTGVYSASYATSTTASIFYDTWWSGSAESHGASITDGGTTIFVTGSVQPQTVSPSSHYAILNYVTNITNLKRAYDKDELARFRLFTRLRNWDPTIYTVASTKIQNYQVEDAYYKVYRVVDNYDVIEYGTGSLSQTRLSYDVTGSYFDLDMKLLEPGYLYGVKFVYNSNGSYQEQPETFKFRVEKTNPNV